MGAKTRKLKIEKDGNNSLSIKHKEEIHIFRKSMDLLISSIFNDNTNWISSAFLQQINTNETDFNPQFHAYCIESTNREN